MSDLRSNVSVSRRGFLRAGVGGAALVGLGAGARAAHAAPPPPPAPHGGATDLVKVLVERITGGFNWAEYQRAKQMGYLPYLEEQLDFERIADGATQAMFANHVTIRMAPDERYNFIRASSTNRDIAYAEFDDHTILRRIVSKRQLYERMVEFWTDHFNLDMLDDLVRYFVIGWDRDVIRKHAMGNFHTLLKASAHHSAMSTYLDNDTNAVGKPQENYARELLELYTLGVDNGYTQQDVVEVARCLTGWSFWAVRNATYGDFRYIASRHDNGPKTVLGRRIPVSGKAEGDYVLDMLCWHPNTARFIAGKLAKFFIGYNPDPAIVEAVATAYLNHAGDIRAMLRVLLSPPMMTHATPKLKRPQYFATSLARATGAKVAAVGSSRNYVGSAMAAMGQQPYRWPTPDGYPDSLTAWGKSMLPRWTLASRLLDGREQWATIDPLLALSQVPGGLQPGGQAQGINRMLTGGAMPEDQVLELQMFIDQRSATAQTLRDAISIAASLPSFQWF